MRSQTLSSLFARLVYVYHIDPVRLYEISQSRYRWLIPMLVEQMAALEARDLHKAAAAAVTPFKKPSVAKQDFKRWQKAYTIRPVKRIPRVREYDPDKAREWFEEHGISVIHQPKSEG